MREDREDLYLPWGQLPILSWMPRDNAPGSPTPGSIVGYDYAPWTVIDVRADVPHPSTGQGWTIYRLRPLTVTAVDGAALDRHIGYPPRSGRPYRLQPRYALCSCCGDLMPCRATMRDRAVQSTLAEMKYYGTPGICPHCGDPVTTRMASETLANVVVPGGQTVTFHAGRRACKAALERYRRRYTTDQNPLP